MTEEQLAGAFQDCGQVVDCRMCGDPNSAMRFAFIEFYHEDSVQKVWPPLLARLGLAALSAAVTKVLCAHTEVQHGQICSAVSAWPVKALCWQAIATMNGARVGAYPLRVLPSKTAIVPVNNHFLPRTPEERELCGRTVYVANIDKKVDKQHVLAFFEKHCGACIRALNIACCCADAMGCMACAGLALTAARLQALSPASACWAITTTRRASHLWSFMRQSTPRRRWTAAAHCWVRPADVRRRSAHTIARASALTGARAQAHCRCACLHPRHPCATRRPPAEDAQARLRMPGSARDAMYQPAPAATNDCRCNFDSPSAQRIRRAIAM